MKEKSYKLIMVVVSKGKASKVVDITTKAGADGGTILFGHGAAVRLMLGISVEPEREIVVTLVEEDKVQVVVHDLENELELNEPHKGIVFVLSVDQAIGLCNE